MITHDLFRFRSGSVPVPFGWDPSFYSGGTPAFILVGPQLLFWWDPNLYSGGPVPFRFRSGSGPSFYSGGIPAPFRFRSGSVDPEPNLRTTEFDPVTFGALPPEDRRPLWHCSEPPI